MDFPITTQEKRDEIEVFTLISTLRVGVVECFGDVWWQDMIDIMDALDGCGTIVKMQEVSPHR